MRLPVRLDLIVAVSAAEVSSQLGLNRPLFDVIVVLPVPVWAGGRPGQSALALFKRELPANFLLYPC